MRKSLLAVLSFLCLAQYVHASCNVICYHGTWSYYRTGNGQYNFSNVPASLCTHYIYTFAGLNATTLEVISLDTWLDIDLGGFTSAINLKQTNSNLKVLLSVGGWNEGSLKYSTMASTATGRATFIASVLKMVQTYGFDGFDLDWEYPARRDSISTADKENFASLLKELHEAFNPLGLLVTAAVSALPSSVDISYDVPALSEYLDIINVMTYDFHGASDSFVGHNAPLYSSSKLDSTYADYSLNATINGWIERGASPSKLALGVPFYGANNVLINASNNTPGSAAAGTGLDPGPYTASSGNWGYNEIIEIFAAGGWTEVWDDEQQVPYAYNNLSWLSYDNADSITLKVEFAKSLGLNGIMLWSLETDDFLGLNGTKNALLNAINTALQPAISDPSLSVLPTTTRKSLENTTMRKSLLAILSFLCLAQYAHATSNVICYHGTWSYYRTGNGKFTFSDVPANLCTHYIYTFVGLNSTSLEVISLDTWLDIDLGGFTSAINLKQTNPDLKVILAVGGWNEGSAKYSTMASTATGRATFIASALNLVQTYGFDGFDLDWEYPARRDSTNTADKENFASLVKEFYEVFNPLGLLVTAAVSATPSSVDISYDVPVLSEYLDIINVMTYDFHGAFDSFVAHNAPLYSSSKLGSTYADYSLNASINGWIERGASPSKLALGVPFYGRNNVLTNASNNTPGSAATGTGLYAGPYTATSGFWGYNEIVEILAAGGWTEVWDDEQQVPYAYNNTSWLSYDNPDSITLKVEFAKSLGLNGIMLWSIETEDFLGVNGTQYALLNAINTALNRNTTSNSTTTTTATTVSSDTSTSSSSTSSSSSDSSTSSSSSSSSDSIADANSCTAAGYFRSSSDCSVYYYCQEVNGVYVGSELTCSSGLYYDTTSGVCNWESLVSC
ncbi:acidic mammalian chitinase-like [Anthonomus grandis grandis]|uniref:acidic mammalian chitinase-like n=1 Tax=Anthonomus grandis grandis TaxID=2921223 RepID=UPI00216523D3|nr:acidic mammalian chitinase-like [Anthonomus grandis grandis]